jgi:hypothetical protein
MVAFTCMSFMCVYVCMYVHTYVCMNVHMYMYIHTYICMYVCVCVWHVIPRLGELQDTAGHADEKSTSYNSQTWRF